MFVAMGEGDPDGKVNVKKRPAVCMCVDGLVKIRKAISIYYKRNKKVRCCDCLKKERGKKTHVAM
jgi:hypothetical protein